MGTFLIHRMGQFLSALSSTALLRLVQELPEPGSSGSSSTLAYGYRTDQQESTLFLGEMKSSVINQMCLTSGINIDGSYV